MSSGTASTVQGFASDGPSDEERARRLNAFLREQQRDLINFLRHRTPTEEDAQDVAQESYARLLRYSATEPYEAWKALLYRIATNIAIDQGRRAQRNQTSQHITLDDIDVAAETPTQEEALEQEQDAARIRAVILALPPKCRQVYILRLEGRSYQDIAKHCGISLKMVEKHVSKALAALRHEAGISPSGAFR